MYYKVENGQLYDCPRNFTLSDGRKVFNFYKTSPEIVLANGFADTIIEGEISTGGEWYEQNGSVIIHHRSR